MNFYKQIHIIAVVIFAIICNDAYAAKDRKPVAIDNRIRTFIHSPNEVYTLEFNHGYQSYIEFAAGEHIKTIAVGDAVSWNITPAGKRIFIKPLEKEGKTNMVVITNRYSYMFDVVARDQDAQDTIYIARFYHPDRNDAIDDGPYDMVNSDGGNIFNGNPTQKASVDADEGSPRYNLQKTNHSYSIEGSVKITPKEIFDNGKVTFIRFPDNFRGVPRIYKVLPDFGEKALEMFEYKDYVLIDGVHEKLNFRYKDQIVNIENQHKV